MCYARVVRGVPVEGRFASSAGLGSASRGAHAAGTLRYLQDKELPGISGVQIRTLDKTPECKARLPLTRQQPGESCRTACRSERVSGRVARLLAWAVLCG